MVTVMDKVVLYKEITPNCLLNVFLHLPFVLKEITVSFKLTISSVIDLFVANRKSFRVFSFIEYLPTIYRCHLTF